jgi:hypothetical protein
LAPSSSSSSFRRFPRHLPTLLTSFVAKPVSLETLSTSSEVLSVSSEVLSVSSEALSYVFVVFSFFKNCIAQPSIVNPPFTNIKDGSHSLVCSLCYLLGIFRFDFFKIRSIHFRMSSSYTCLSTLFLGVAASVCCQDRPHTMPMHRSVSNTLLQVDLTRKRVQSMGCPLQCCIYVALPHPPLPLVHLHCLMQPSSLFWVLYFTFLFIFFPVFLRVHSTICNYSISVVWGGLWNLFGFVLLLGSFGCVISHTPSLATFIGIQFSWTLHQESIGPCHSFDALPLLFFLYLSFWWFKNFLFWLPNP